MKMPDKNLAAQLAEFKARSDTDEKLTGWVGRSHGARDLNIHLSSAYRHGQILTLAEHLENVQASVAAALEAAISAVTKVAVKWGVTGEPAILIATKEAIRALITPDQRTALQAAIDVAKAEARAEDAVKLQSFDSADWFWRPMDPDDNADNPAEVIHRAYFGQFTICEIASSYRGPTRFGFNAPVLDPESDDEEFLHFETQEDAMEAAKSRQDALDQIGAKP